MQRLGESFLTGCGLIGLAALLCSAVALDANAQMFGKDFAPCGDQPNTVAIVACIQGKTTTWDRRLNTAYKALAVVVDPAQQEPLKAAQRLWITYRDANCKFYAAHEGTISQVLAAECLRSMTQDRALELERAAKP